MAKLTKELKIVEPGKVYPQTLEAGSECPEWAISTATQLGFLEGAPIAKKAISRSPKNKAITDKDLLHK